MNRHHPEAPNPDDNAPLWPIKRGYDPDDRENCAAHPRTARDWVDDAAESAGLDKDTNHHAFRHACVKRLRYEHGCDWDHIGNRTMWSDSSVAEMAQIYGKLTGDERRNSLRDQMGMETETDDDEPEEIDCWRCGESMAPHLSVCPNRACAASQENDPSPCDNDACDSFVGPGDDYCKACGTRQGLVEDIKEWAERAKEHPDINQSDDDIDQFTEDVINAKIDSEKTAETPDLDGFLEQRD